MEGLVVDGPEPEIKRNPTCCGKRCDNEKKQKIIYSVFIYGTFFWIGWIRGLFGPSFPDIQYICDVNLKLASWIVTTFFIGYTFGSLAGGFLHDKIDHKLIFGTSLFILAIAVVGTPWCYLFSLMILAHLVQGFCQGVVDTIGNSEILLIWKNNRMLYFCLELLYGTGSFGAPLLSAPFLMEIPEKLDILPTNTSLNSIRNRYSLSSPNTSSDLSFHDMNVNDTTTLPTAHFKSLIFIPYSITSFCILCTSVGFFALFFIYKNDNVLTNTKDQMELSADRELDTRKPRELPFTMKVCTLLPLSAMFLFYVGVSEALVSYLTVFVVEYLDWTPADGALITAITNICGMVAIVVSLFMKCLNTLVYAGINCTMVCISFLGILFSSLYYYELGMWISCGIHGYFRAMIFSLTFTWTNDYIMQVTGRISSLFMISACIGATMNPVILGNVMDRFGDIWLCYLFVIEGFIVLVLYFVNVGLTRYIVKHFGKTFDKTHTYDATISVTETFIKEHET